MKCFNNFKGDRFCELCQVSNNSEFQRCKENHNNEISYNKKIEKIVNECPLRQVDYDEYTEFYSCNKNGNDYGRFAERCKPDLSCVMYK